MLNWLKKIIGLGNDSTKEKSADGQNGDFDKIVVGKVVEVKKHPNADKLKIAMVDVGTEIRKLGNWEIGEDEIIQIVCGGTNLKEGMWVPVALPGAKVRWHGEGDLVELEEATIRGEKSFGMICAANEISLFDKFPHGEMEIIDLSGVEGIEVGQPVVEIINNQTSMTKK